MSRSTVYLGLDCGGSTSRVLAVNSEGTTVFSGQSGAANVASTPVGRLAGNLRKASQGCPEPDFVCGCFAGVVDARTEQLGHSLLREIFASCPIRIEPDYAAALAASPTHTDICVIAGTGSLVCSRVGGQLVKSGGRGYLLGDEGSGFHMGRAALLQWLNDPGAGSEALRLGIESVFGTLIEGELVRAVYGGSPGPTLAKLAGTCFTCAKQGEEWASRAVNEQLGRLAQVVAKHADQHFPGKNPINLSLAGGVWKEGKMVVEVFEATLRDARPGIAWSPGILKRPPVLGAVALAKEMDR